MNNVPRQQLCEIIKLYGKDVCIDHKRIRGLLNDFCRGNYPEITFLLTALEEHVFTELMTSTKTVPYEMLSARLVKRLYTNRGMAEEIAHWTVDSWALALGVILHETETLQPQLQVLSGPPRLSTITEAKSYAYPDVQQTIVVSPTEGQYTTINEAMRNAPPDTLILVRPGFYHEGLVIDKRIQIKGDGPKEHIVVESKFTSCIHMKTNCEVLVQGLTLRCNITHTNRECHAIDISIGQLKLIDCDVTSNTSESACIHIQGHSTRPEIRNCQLHGANGSGIFMENNALGTIENCDIFGNAYPNISIRRYATPIIRKCKIYGGKTHGILVWQNGRGTIEDCDIFDNAYDGVKIKDGGTAIVTDCHIYANARQEEWVYQKGWRNTNFPRQIKTSSILHRRGNPIARSKEVFTGIGYTTESAIHQQEVESLTKKKPSLINLFLRSIRFSKEK